MMLLRSFARVDSEKDFWLDSFDSRLPTYSSILRLSVHYRHLILKEYGNVRLNIFFMASLIV